jgi:energy-coupling factor transporter transmembrane protein EcfT
MEARGYGRAGRTSVPRPRWRARDAIFVALAVAIVAAGALWL